MEDRREQETRRALAEERGKVAKAAHRLGVSRQALYIRMLRHGISLTEYRTPRESQPDTTEQ